MWGRVAAYVPWEIPSKGPEVVEILEMIPTGEFIVRNWRGPFLAREHDLTLLIDQHDMDEYIFCNLVVVAGNQNKDFVLDYGKYLDYDMKSDQILIRLHMSKREVLLPREWLARLEWSPFIHPRH